MIRPACFISTVGQCRGGVAASSVELNTYLPHSYPHECYDPSFSAFSSILASLPTTITSVQVFDGSAVNGVITSNSFWSTISSKLPYFILGQLLASITFVVVLSFIAAQGKFVFDQASSNYNSEERNKSQLLTTRADDNIEPPQPDFTKLLICICIDVLGSANEAIPLVGEVVDVVYAPVAALLLRQLFAGSNVVFLLEFTEEILPFTDILPLATICWVISTFYASGTLARALRIGDFAPNRLDSGDAGANVKENARTKLLLQSTNKERDDR